MIIYRVEGPDGIGPYQTLKPDWSSREPELIDLADAVAREHSDCPDHPSPCFDGIGHLRDEHEICGFSSPDDLKTWFAGWLRKLHRAGYVVAVYDVPDHGVRHGGHQVVFKPGVKIAEMSVLTSVDTLARVK
jgi:hypothetical protein